MSTVLATYNIKGGVGKTSAAVNLAYLAARAGHETLIWDLDPQAATTYLFRVKPSVEGGGRKLVKLESDIAGLIRGTDFRGLDLLPADFSYRHMDLALDGFKNPTRRLARVLEPLHEHYDYIFLDCPPSISLVSESVFEAADALLVPIIPATLSSRTFDQLTHLIESVDRSRVAAAERSEAGVPPRGPQILAFFSMVEVRKSLHREVMARVRAAYPGLMLGAAIPSADEVERMGEDRTVVEQMAPGSRAAIAYGALWWDIKRRLARARPSAP